MSSDRTSPRPGAPTTGPTWRVNDQIRLSPLSVVDTDGTMLGTFPRDKALELARQKELDLVEVAPMARPPVCKIMDFGKFKYEQTRKTRKAKAHQTQVKEIRFRPGCGHHDLEVKVRHAREFLEEKHKVMIVVQFKGRENAHTEFGVELAKQVIEMLADVAKVERSPAREVKRVIAVLAPK